MGKNFVFECLFFSFFFSTKNQVPQKIIGLGRMIYHNKAVSVVIQTTLKTSQKFPRVEKNRLEIFDFSSYFWASKTSAQAYISLFVPYFSPENLISLG